MLVCFVHGIGGVLQSSESIALRAQLFEKVFAPALGWNGATFAEISWGEFLPSLDADRLLRSNRPMRLGPDADGEGDLTEPDGLEILDEAYATAFFENFEVILSEIERGLASVSPEMLAAQLGLQSLPVSEALSASAAGGADGRMLLGDKDLAVTMSYLREQAANVRPKRFGIAQRLWRFLFRFPVGDALFYLLSERYESVPTIRSAVAAKLRGQLEGRPRGEPVVLIGHSFGGVILVDILQEALLGKDLERPVALVTVGSQCALFLELVSAARKIAPQNLALTGVDKWVNVYSTGDFAGLPAGMFGAVDLEEDKTFFGWNPLKGVIEAHTSYFNRLSFHHNLGVRLRAELYGFELPYNV